LAPPFSTPGGIPISVVALLSPVATGSTPSPPAIMAVTKSTTAQIVV
jgi:hypothetical protein